MNRTGLSTYTIYRYSDISDNRLKNTVDAAIRYKIIDNLVSIFGATSIQDITLINIYMYIYYVYYGE